MQVPHQSEGVIRFGAFEVDLSSGKLEKYGVRIRLQEQPFQILAMLLHQPGKVVTREELRKRLWAADTFVDFDVGLNNAILRLRNALGDSAERPRFIETLPRRGYRFIAAVSGPASGPHHDSMQSATASHPQLVVLPAPEAATAIVNPSLKRSRMRKIAISGLALSGLLTLAVGLNVAGLRHRILGGPDPQAIRSLAVLPLDNLSGDPAQDYFADGMTDELTTVLAKISALRVISRTSAMRYRGARGPVQQIAHELKVDALIEGSVARSGNRVRITAQLIDARNDRHMWADSYERDLGDILNTQNTVAMEIAHQVLAKLTPAEREALATRSTVVPEAYDAYLRGRKELGKQRQEALRNGLEYFQQATSLDRLYAPAYAGLADSYSLLVNYGALPPLEGFPEAKSAALKALELDHNSAEAHTSLAFVKHHFDWDWAGAAVEYKLAIQLDPNNAITHLRYAELLSNLARHDDAIREVRLAHELDPLSLVIQSNIGRLLYYARRYDEAIPELKQVLGADPHRVFARVFLAKCYEEKNMYSESRAELETVRAEFNGQESIGEAHLAASVGRVQDARRILKYQEQPSPDGVQDWVFIAGVHAQLGEKDKAFQWLGQGYQNHDFFMTYLKTDPAMDPLRSDPRFTLMLQKIGFPLT